MTDPIGTLVIFGASGDLTKRLLLPGIGQVLEVGRETPLRIVGVGHEPLTDDAWRERITASFAAGKVTGTAATDAIAASSYLQADATSVDDLRRVIEGADGTPALYFALPPAVTIAACRALEHVDLPEGTVFALEKPFGEDLRSARRFNAQLAKLVPERQIHRVDHFLGKSTVLNLLGLRFANRLFEQVWNRDNIERVEIVFDEQLGLEGRAGYYDTAGAMVDMIQSHLLLVLAIFTMEPPSTIDADDLRGSMAQALRATRVLPGESSHRARYTAGEIRGVSLPSYVDEQGIDPERSTETLAQVVFGVDNWRWAGVPFVLRSGKALGDARKEIVVTFKEVPHLPTGFRGRAEPVLLRISLSPDRLELDLNLNGAGDPFELDRVTLDATLGAGELGPYGEVISGILDADPTLSVRADMVEECWRIVEPVRRAWKKDAVPLEEYAAGSDGPAGWDR